MNRVAVVFTPYSVRTGLVDALLNDIEKENGCTVILRRRIALTQGDVEALYPTLVTRDFFPLIIGCLAGGVAEVVILITEELHSRISQVKGRFRYENGAVFVTGLRQKHQKDGHSFEFILHTTDSNSETNEIGERLFGDEYHTVLRAQGEKL